MRQTQFVAAPVVLHCPALDNGSAKGAIGAVFNIAKTTLANTGGLGENASQFSADVLAKLITPEMTVKQELESVLNLP